MVSQSPRGFPSLSSSVGALFTTLKQTATPATLSHRVPSPTVNDPRSTEGEEGFHTTASSRLRQGPSGEFPRRILLWGGGGSSQPSFNGCLILASYAKILGLLDDALLLSSVSFCIRRPGTSSHSLAVSSSMSELILPHKPIRRMDITRLDISRSRTVCPAHHPQFEADLNAGMCAVQGYLQTSVSRTARPQRRNQQKQEKDWEATPSYIDKSQCSLPRLSVPEQWAWRSHRPVIYSSSVERLSVDAPWDVFNQSVFHTLGNFHDSTSHARSNTEFDNEMGSSCQAPQKVLPATEIASGP
ncbi:hypothetical protein DFH09DRAFT_1073387 [Mycena vulgaris]|nr:hypothetical protein DFH09DRAFT_1073387 [Mycena vulgaris]